MLAPLDYGWRGTSEPPRDPTRGRTTAVSCAFGGSEQLRSGGMVRCESLSAGAGDVDANIGSNASETYDRGNRMRNIPVYERRLRNRASVNEPKARANPKSLRYEHTHAIEPLCMLKPVLRGRNIPRRYDGGPHECLR